MSSIFNDLLNVSGNLVLYRIAMDKKQKYPKFWPKNKLYIIIFAKMLMHFRELTSQKWQVMHGFNTLCIVKGLNRKMEIKIAWHSQKNRKLMTLRDFSLGNEPSNRYCYKAFCRETGFEADAKLFNFLPRNYRLPITEWGGGGVPPRILDRGVPRRFRGP